MCGFVVTVGGNFTARDVEASCRTLRHRGPDAQGFYTHVQRNVHMAHVRLKVIDLGDEANQPMCSADGRYVVVYNGEIYNYRELREQLRGYPFRTQSDTEVLLAAFSRWGLDCLDRCNGMFAFVVLDVQSGELVAARDRFGVKPLYYARLGDALVLASEIKAICHLIPSLRSDNEVAWASYLRYGRYPEPEETFYKGIYPVPAGHVLKYREGEVQVSRWYRFVERVRSYGLRDTGVEERYEELLHDALQLRFRSDVELGVSLSGGLDSALLVGLMRTLGRDRVRAFHFVTGDMRYDERPWVEAFLRHNAMHLEVVQLQAGDVPRLALEVMGYEDEPYGGIPTLAYSGVFERARSAGTIVVLDGQGMDEQWAGYDYYARVEEGEDAVVPVQGSSDSPVRPQCMVRAFYEIARRSSFPRPFGDALQNLQYRDIFYTKLPRALRFNDRISMMWGIELREPFLDYRLVEMAFAMPARWKIRQGVHKYLLRKIASRYIPEGVALAPKRPVQTPQREWLREALHRWVEEMIQRALDEYGGQWLDPNAVWKAYREYKSGVGDNSFFLWQWVSVGMWAQIRRGHATIRA